MGPGYRSCTRYLKMAAAALLMAAVAACASPFKADVSRFQSHMPAPQGQSFAVVADDPALAGGIEFSQYAELVAINMERIGYARATPETATLLVRFAYGVDQGRERIRSTGASDPFYSSWYGYRPYWGHRGFYGRPWGYGWYDPWFDRGGVESYTVYTSGLDLKIDRAVDSARLFEGRAQALSTSNRLQHLVPNLVEAMFTDFPGNSGETVRISIAPEKTTVKKVERKR